MDFKLLFVSVACLAFLIPQSNAGQIGTIKSAAKNTVSDIVSIVPKMVKAKSAAVVKAAADIASIITTGMGLKIRALAQASSSVKGAMADGVIAIGDSISNAGNSIVAAKLGAGSTNGRITVKTPVVEEVKVERPVIVEEVQVKNPTVVEEIEVMSPVLQEEVVAVPCEQEVIEVDSFPISSVQLRVQPPRVPVIEPSPRFSFVANKASSVWNLLMNAARSKVNSVGNLFNVFNAPIRSGPVYEIVERPRVYEGPLIETFKIEKK
ncbi:uncharacterized protein LOC142979925 [Anticarsia gemmatalis]|uniref:uncharacterized protein LOC142979925 n=1 Tax=Anticarsia gemmatalis TaxID=129554 RepID=UPI003F75A422